MKLKIQIVAIFLAMTVVTFGQVTNKNGTMVTPEKGDWVLGFDAVPLFNYVGNIFNGTNGNSISANWATTNNAIYGKYYVSEGLAYRGSLRLMNFSQTNITLTDTLNPAPVGSSPMYISDKVKLSGSAIVLGGGLEMRKGKSRLQGFYGAEALITLGGTTPNRTYTYELEMNDKNVNQNYVPTSRSLSTKAGTSFGFGIRGFIGIEYFVFPKISIGAEYGWGLNYIYTTGGEAVTENWGIVDGGTNPSAYEITTQTGGNKYFGIDTDNNGGAIKILFHF